MTNKFSNSKFSLKLKTTPMKSRLEVIPMKTTKFVCKDFKLV